MKAMKPYVIAIDLGGTNTVFGLVDPNGHITQRCSLKTQQYPDLNQYVTECTHLITTLCEQAGGKHQIQAIGIGAPDVNYWQQTIENATNLPWKGIVPLARDLETKTGIPTHITNDAKAAALGEMQYGAARGMKNFIMLTLGTGVGSGIVIDGKLVYGHRSFAGELGHASIRPEKGRPCPCGRRGCLEAYCSATGVAQTAREMLQDEKYASSLLHQHQSESISSKDVYEAACLGDVLANEIFRFTGQLLGESCANFATFCDPEAFIFFGGLAQAGDLLMKPIEETYRHIVFENYRDTARFLLSGLKNADAALLGAAALAWTYE